MLSPTVVANRTIRQNQPNIPPGWFYEWYEYQSHRYHTPILVDPSDSHIVAAQHGLEPRAMPTPQTRYQMGVYWLSKKAKALASVRVHLNDGLDHVIMDGGFLNHRLCTRNHAASSLLFHDDIEPLVKEYGVEVNKFERRGYQVTIVFDGAASPTKTDTSQDRAKKREESASAARCLAADGGVCSESTGWRRALVYSTRV